MMEFSNEKLMIEMHSHLKALRKRADVLEARLDNQVELLKQVLLEYYPEEEEASHFAEECYYTGDIIEPITLEECEWHDEPSKYSVYCKEMDEHITHPKFKNINHSCNPNTIPFKIDNHFGFLVIKPIDEDEEVTFNYLHNENEISNPFDCYCGSTNCVGRVE